MTIDEPKAKVLDFTAIHLEAVREYRREQCTHRLLLALYFVALALIAVALWRMP